MASSERAVQMAQDLEHRGPDGCGVWQNAPNADNGPRVAFSHRRLAILDLSDAGLQPMKRGSLTITYNGEIYNFRALKAELAADGVELTSNTDTEVVLQLFARYGAQCVHRLIGMFAFAIWDQTKQRLFVARDRLGIKPLLYRNEPDGFAFASQLGPLSRIAPSTLDLTAIRDFFSYKYIPTPKTIFEEIKKLPAAHTLTLEPGKQPVLEEYWQPQSSTKRTDLAEATHELDHLLHEVITEHTLSDVPVGVFLSGGVDSSTVTSHLQQPYTFNLGFDVKSHDETAEARTIAEHLGAHHTTLRATGGDLSEALRLIARIYDEPFGDHGAFPVYQIARLARQHNDHPVTVALTGEGGDELFAGYQWHDKQGRLKAKARHRLLHQLAPPNSAAFRTAERRLLQGVERYATFLGPFTVSQKQALLSDDLLIDQGYDDLWAFQRHWREDLGLTKRLQWMDLHGYLRDDMMTKLDRATMAVGLEARPPLVDHRVVEFALSLAPDLLYQPRSDRKPGVGKRVLREALKRRVPPALLTQKKIGFSAPIRRWSQQQPELLKQAQQRLYERQVLRRPSTRLATNEQTWCMLVLDQWLNQHA